MAPGSETTTLSPVSKLWAPQTMPRGSASPTSTWHQRMVLPFDWGSSAELEHLAHDDRAGDVERVHVLFLEPHLHEGGVQVLERDVLGEVDPLPQPADRDAHQTTIPNCCEKRTSPSTMSRMSFMSLRNCSVRSMPMPKAKPW